MKMKAIVILMYIRLNTSLKINAQKQKPDNFFKNELNQIYLVQGRAHYHYALILAEVIGRCSKNRQKLYCSISEL